MIDMSLLHFGDFFMFEWSGRNSLKATLRDILNSRCTITGPAMFQECTVDSWMSTKLTRNGRQRGFCSGH